MDQKGIIDKVQDLVRNGDVDQAKSFIEDHKDDLGDYYQRAKDLLGNDGSGITDKIKNMFGK
ncbi:hypothetical protein [Lentilactobacillus laojiaonis]|uniref:hypothetical protein n=1 Tax=Lentilactobacillus laojiaonis TaxID=2883998 RepID=UPI001D0A38E1|nr:hypothetical protein [Lentilactobacillus laojiaonis]UDM31785.1 hypothetical protein LHL71_04365 [Lentilactobacillus laojiaonis]